PSPIAIPAIDADTYGPATPAIRELLDQARTLRWFPIVTGPFPTPSVKEHITAHLHRLTELFPQRPGLSSLPLNWMTGSFEDFDRLCPQIDDTEGWGDPLGPSEWGRYLLHLSQDVRKVIAGDPELLRYIKPPLWPAPGLINVVGTALYEG